METDSRNYVLDIEDRAIRDFNGHKEWNLESSSGHSGYSYDYKFEYKGYNKYLGWIAGHEIHESHSPGFHLKYDGERIAKYKVENNESISQNTPILYGGSMNAGNANELIACADIDGGLIGGAALKAEDFLQICKAG